MAASVSISHTDIRLLRIFDTVVECGGFAAAQVELNVGQSTISSHMAALESRLGVRLCERGRGGFRLTEQGRNVHNAAKRLFREIESFRADVEGTRGRLAGELYIGTVDSVITNPDFSLSTALRRFKERGGDVRIHLSVGRPAEIERAVVDGSLHVGIGAYTRQIAGMVHIPLLTERQCLYCGPGHPLFGMRQSRTRFDKGGPWEYVRRAYVPDLDIPDAAWLKATAVAENMEAIAFLVLSGRFLGFLPEHYAAKWASAGALQAVKPETMHYQSHIELLVRSSAQSLCVRLFVEDLLAAFRCNTANDNPADWKVASLVSGSKP